MFSGSVEAPLEDSAACGVCASVFSGLVRADVAAEPVVPSPLVAMGVPVPRPRVRPRMGVLLSPPRPLPLPLPGVGVETSPTGLARGSAGCDRSETFGVAPIGVASVELGNFIERWRFAGGRFSVVGVVFFSSDDSSKGRLPAQDFSAPACVDIGDRVLPGGGDEGGVLIGEMSSGPGCRGDPGLGGILYTAGTGVKGWLIANGGGRGRLGDACNGVEGPGGRAGEC